MEKDVEIGIFGGTVQCGCWEEFALRVRQTLARPGT